jgi:hypothetical protein
LARKFIEASLTGGNSQSSHFRSFDNNGVSFVIEILPDPNSDINPRTAFSTIGTYLNAQTSCIVSFSFFLIFLSVAF